MSGPSRRGRPRAVRRAVAAVAVVCAFLAPAARAERTEKAPPELDGVGVTEHRGDPLPLERVYVDEEGRPFRLGDAFDGRHPVVLNLGYYGCPMLCGLVLNGLTDGMKRLDLTPGADYRVVTLSINPRETPTLAKAKKQNYIRELGRPSSAGGWNFLTGREEDIRAVTDAVGFGYRWDEATQMYAHAAVIVVCTPDGKISRYLYGIEFEPRTLRLALVEAAEGKIGSPLDQILLFCFHYDAREGRYALAAAGLMRLGGVATAVALGAFLLALWRREKRRRGTS